MGGRAYDSRAYRKAQAALKRQGLPCSWCGGDILYGLPPAEARRHPLSFTADHVHSLATGGDAVGTLRPMHQRRCNSQRGDGTRQDGAPRTDTSRRW